MTLQRVQLLFRPIYMTILQITEVHWLRGIARPCRGSSWLDQWPERVNFDLLVGRLIPIF